MELAIGWVGGVVTVFVVFWIDAVYTEWRVRRLTRKLRVLREQGDTNRPTAYDLGARDQLRRSR